MRKWKDMGLLEVVLRVPTHTLNFFTGGNIRNSLSARTGKASNDGKKWGKVAEKVINVIMFFDTNHCYNEYLNEFKHRL